MPFLNIARAVFAEPWAITADAHRAVQDLVAARIAGTAAPAALDLGGERSDAPPPYAIHGEHAVVPVQGILGKRLGSLEVMCGGCDFDAVLRALYQADADPRASGALVLDFNSPGGTVNGTAETASRIAELSARREVVAFSDTLCASAAYWMASACTALVASPSSTWGSIGVRAALLDDSAAFEKAGLQMHVFQSGQYKAMGHPGKPAEQAELDLLSARVAEMAEGFFAAVRAARPGVSAESMQGQLFDGAAAHRAGLVDGLVLDLDDLLEQLG